MLLKDFIEGIQDFIKENPEAKDYTVITSKDDEGNGYSETYWWPCLGEYNGENFMQDDWDENLREIMQCV